MAQAIWDLANEKQYYQELCPEDTKSVPRWEWEDEDVGIISGGQTTTTNLGPSSFLSFMNDALIISANKGLNHNCLALTS